MMQFQPDWADLLLNGTLLGSQLSCLRPPVDVGKEEREECYGTALQNVRALFAELKKSYQGSSNRAYASR